MKVVDLLGDGNGNVLLVKQKGKISAIGTKCTHYGAPLVNGHLGDGRVRCQWHGACFNIANGEPFYLTSDSREFCVNYRYLYE